MESIQIYLNSQYADKYNNGSFSDCDFNLPIINIEDGFYIYLSVVHALIPFSFYNINSTNNKLSYQIASTVYNITIPTGNYNITNLLNTLSTLMPFFTISYDGIKNLLTFKYTLGANFTFLSSSTCFEIIGFRSGNSYVSSATILTSIYSVNVYCMRCININSNLITYNINKNQINNSSILCCIPINETPYSMIEYNNVNNFRTNLFINSINKINIRLADDKGNLIDLNGMYFNITIQLDVVQFT